MYPQLSTDQFAVVQRQSGPEWSPDPVNDFNPWACVDQKLKISKSNSFLVFQNDLRQGIVLHLIRLVLFGLFQVNTEKSVFLGKISKISTKKVKLTSPGQWSRSPSPFVTRCPVRRARTPPAARCSPWPPVPAFWSEINEISSFFVHSSSIVVQLEIRQNC